METLKQTDISSNNKETPTAPKKYSKIMKSILNGNKENDKNTIKLEGCVTDKLEKI